MRCTLQCTDYSNVNRSCFPAIRSVFMQCRPWCIASWTAKPTAHNACLAYLDEYPSTLLPFSQYFILCVCVCMHPAHIIWMGKLHSVMYGVYFRKCLCSATTSTCPAMESYRYYVRMNWMGWDGCGSALIATAIAGNIVYTFAIKHIGIQHGVYLQPGYSRRESGNVP